MRCADCGKHLSTKPRFATKPTKNARTWQTPILKAAERLGTPPMPWQKGSIRIIAELRSDGLPRFKTVGVSVPRQSGKTTLSRAAITAKAESKPRLDIFGTAQSRQYAASHVIKLGESLDGVKMLRGVGAESVTWPNGSTYMPISPTEGGGHGDSIDFLLVDEGWTITASLLGGVRPAMIARPMSQLLLISTMGTIESTAWNGFVSRGRESVDDPDATMAWIEYSAERDEDVFDEDKWHDFMPALGRTISHEDVRSAMNDLEAAEGVSEVIRAFGNRTTRSMVTIWPADKVEAAWKVIQPPQRFVLAVDVNDEPQGASIATGHVAEDGTATRLVEWRYGSPRWVPEAVKQMIAHRRVEAVVADLGGPSKQIQADLTAVCESAFVPLVDRKPRELGADTQRFYDALRTGRAFMERTEPLVEAIQGSHRKQFGDLWVVSRTRMAVDASPILATIMAHGLAEELAVNPVVEDVVFSW